MEVRHGIQRFPVDRYMILTLAETSVVPIACNTRPAAEQVAVVAALAHPGLWRRHDASTAVTPTRALSV
jgi:hypothetical protein